MALRTAGFVFLILPSLFQSLLHGVNAQQSPSPLLPFGAEHGDDVSPDVSNKFTLSLPYNISFLGFNYSTLTISPDGTIAFENGEEVKYDENIKYFGGIRNPSTDVPFIAPLLYRSYRPRSIASSEYQGRISYRFVDATSVYKTPSSEDLDIVRNLTHYLPGTVVHAPDNFEVKYLVIVTWDNVAEGPEVPGSRECKRSSPCDSATFQVALAGDSRNTFVMFNYLQYSLSVQPSYEAGFNAGKGRGWHNVLPCQGSDGCTTQLANTAISGLPTFQGSDLVGRYIFSVAQERVIRGGCLPKELTAGILEIYPRTVGMFGGEKLEVSGVCGSPGAVIYCRFGAADGGNVTANGTLVNSMKGFCPVPPLTTAGHLDVYLLNANRQSSAYHSINVVLPSRLRSPVVIDSDVRLQWHRRDSKEITVKWESTLFTRNASAQVDIKLIGYREYVDKVEYEELRTFGTVQSQLNSFTFNVDQNSCDSDCEKYEIGLLEVSLPPRFYSVSAQRVAVRFGPIPLGWYVNKQLQRQRGSDWSNQKCKEWHTSDGRDASWIQKLLPCPCTLQQALGDFGRWQPDPGCNLFTNSQCYYHGGAKHCVRSVAATPQDGSGNQCCYNADGTLKHSQLSYNGSTPDRSHAWGAYPYNRADRVPELSHWKHDVISFYYCCLWNQYELCDLYMELRPTTDCRSYDVPGFGFVHGLTHVKTFDGLTYNFASAGDFWLAQDKNHLLMVQGKFEPNIETWDLGKMTRTSSWQPRSLTGLAISAGKKKLEVSLTFAGVQLRRLLDIRVDGELQYFLRNASLWQDFQEFSIINNAASASDNHHSNFTILLSRYNVGVNVVASHGLLQVALAVPPSFKPKQGQTATLLGLLGAYDGKPENDFQTKTGEVVPSGTNRTTVFGKFVLSWALGPQDYKIFRFENTAEELDPQHSYFEDSQIPTNFPGAPTPSSVDQVCGTSANCQWDFKISGDEDIASSTRQADTWYQTLQQYATFADSCGLPEVGSLAILSNENFTPQSQLRVTGCKHGQTFSTPVQFSCVRETVEEAIRNNRADYGTKRRDSNNVEYITHWVPRPYAVCTEVDTGESTNLPLIIGASVGGVVAVIIIIVIVIIVVKKRKSGSASPKPKERKPEERRKKTEQDPGAAEAMLSRVEDRSPVYKPSKDAVRMSDVQGSNV